MGVEWWELMVDPVSLVVAALVAGAASGSTAAVSQAVQDAYASLKGLLLGRFRQQPDPVVAGRYEEVLAELEMDPQLYPGPLTQALTAVGVERDEQVLAAARLLLQHADPGGAAAGVYDLRGAQGVQINYGSGSSSQVNDFRTVAPQPPRNPQLPQPGGGQA